MASKRSVVRRVVAPLAMAVLAFLLPACTPGADARRQAVTVWMYPVIADPGASRRYWAEIERDFERTAPELDLVLTHQPWEGRDEKLIAALARGHGPDVALLAPDQIPRLVTDGLISPVERVLGDRAEAFLPAALEVVSHDGHVYAAPVYQTVATTIYNMRLLRAAGVSTPPGTWDEIAAAAPRLRSKGIALLDYSTGDAASLNLNFYPLLWQAGGSVFTEDGRKVAFDGPPGVAALTFLRRLYAAGAIPPSAMTNTNLVAGQALGRQEAAMGYSVVLANADVAARLWGPENVLVGGPLKGPVKEVAFGMPGSLAVNAAGNRAGAERFLSFMTEPRQIRSLGRASGFFSPRTDVTVPSDSPYAREYQAALASVFPGEPHPASRRVMMLLSPEIRAALTGRKSPGQALRAAAAAANALLARERGSGGPR
ncbi:ABC transporter substrate-binding protein [Streptomyces sp. NPDC051310]|uniref:ABC transporter substrate-binding protein n=1 Tax=Streptomyces sp. NPDC051310 TaxID=3365649 RepID=UPI0037BB324F